MDNNEKIPSKGWILSLLDTAIKNPDGSITIPKNIANGWFELENICYGKEEKSRILAVIKTENWLKMINYCKPTEYWVEDAVLTIGEKYMIYNVKRKERQFRYVFPGDYPIPINHCDAEKICLSLSDAEKIAKAVAGADSFIIKKIVEKEKKRYGFLVDIDRAFSEIHSEYVCSAYENLKTPEFNATSYPCLPMSRDYLVPAIKLLWGAEKIECEIIGGRLKLVNAKSDCSILLPNSVLHFKPRDIPQDDKITISGGCFAHIIAACSQSSLLEFSIQGNKLMIAPSAALFGTQYILEAV